MAQSVIVKKEQKVEKVFNTMQNIDDLQEFKNVFKSLFPDDWKRIQQIYEQHEQRDKKGKGHPMPKPEIYLSNMYKVYRKKLNK